jgi:hypothetical protein
LNLPQIEGEKIKEQGPVTLGFYANHIRKNAMSNLAENIFQVGGFAPPPRSYVDDFDLHFLIANMNNRHAGILVLLSG